MRRVIFCFHLKTLPFYEKGGHFMSNYAALSGNTTLLVQNRPTLSKTESKTHEVAAQKELAAFLDVADQAENANELQTLTDKFFGPDAEVNNAEKGTLTAEAILNNSVLSPTGTQVISTLNLTADTVEQFKGLRNFEISFLFRRLATFVPALQETYGRKLTTFTDSNSGSEMPCEYGGYYGILDPLMLASYVPYAEALEDLRDSQIEECFHGFSLIDGYPTIQGKPLWERQEWERVDYYNLFKLYRDMRYAFYNDVDALYVSRSLSVLAKAVQLAPSTVNYLAQVYNWGLRATMYDTWMATMQQRRQAIKRNLMLDRHTKIAQALTAKAFEALRKQADKMSPREAIQLLELGLKYERISAGMSGDKPEAVGGQATSNGPLLSIVNQTNNSSGPMQINQAAPVAQRLQDDMKRPDTLLSILSVLQRSGALNTALNSVPVEVTETEVIDDESADE
jgi:hypothetical protein